MDQTEQFFGAVERGDREAVDTMLKADARLALAWDPDGATALHHAAFHGHREIVELLLKSGADINARDREYGATPAGWAIHLLRERGALLAVEIEDVRLALERGDVAWVERWVARHPALARASDREGTPLASHAAANPPMARVFERHSNDPPDAR